MAYSSEYINRFAWSLALPATESGGTHPTEDWRHGVQVVEQGLRVAFAEGAHVFTPLRDTLAAATEQGIRWERGRLANARTNALRLLGSGLARLEGRKLVAALDAIQPPVAVLGGVSALVAVLASVVFDSALTVIIAWIPLLMVAAYGVAVVLEGRKRGITAVMLLWAPLYILWRCWAFAVGALAPGRSPDKSSAVNAVGER